MDTQKIQVKLEVELKKLTGELTKVGRINPDNAEDWDATTHTDGMMTADKNEMADALEELEENVAIVADLETRYAHVKKALAALEAGTYGTCSVCGEKIPETRLEANAAATTCVEHAD